MMVHDIGVALQAKLAARKCPFKVIDGPEDTGSTTWGRERIVIERDRDAGDGFGPTRSQRPNPVHRMVRLIAIKVTIYAKEPKTGAVRFEHEGRADHVADLVLIAMGDVAAGTAPIFNVWTQKDARFVTPEDLEGSERFGGAVYEMKLAVERAVKEQDFKGAIAAEATVGVDVDIKNTTTIAGSLETGCGG
jgi:hypothetical protein